MVFDLIFIAPIAAAIALVFAAYFARGILRKPAGSKKMKEIAEAIKVGSMAYLKRQYTTIAIFAVIVAALLYYFIGSHASISFVLGAILSISAGYIGMNVSVRANVRTTEAAKKGLGEALTIAFRGGAVMGLVVVALGLLGIYALYSLYNDPSMIMGFSLGASSVALFARVGGGIYTKGADVGADLVGKVEKGIPEDDPRNPAVIADNVGDNVGDCAGMGADLFESYVGSIIAPMVLGAVIYGAKGAIYPIVIAGFGIIAALIGMFFVRTKENPQKALNYGTYATYAIMIILLYFVTDAIMGNIGIFYAALSGLVAGLVIGWTAEYYTSDQHKPVLSIAEASKTGAGTNLITGFGVGFESTVPPLLVVCFSILVAYHFAGIFGIAVAGLGMLSITGIIVASDTYGPISDNAGGIAEMAGLKEGVRKITDSLDSVGNTAKALTKGFAIGSAALVALSLLSAFYQEAGIQGPIDLMEPSVLVGLFIGGMLSFFFCSLCMKGVGTASHKIVEEVRRQFKEIKGLMEGKAKPDYAKCVDICTMAALSSLVAPGVMALGAPVVVGLLLGPAALVGLLAGATLTGFLLAVLMANAGGAWDNAKKYIEAGHFGGKGTPAHAAAVIGDTLGDPFKDTAGPSLNILIKLMAIVSLVLAPLFVKYALHII